MNRRESGYSEGDIGLKEQSDRPSTDFVRQLKKAMRTGILASLAFLGAGPRTEARAITPAEAPSTPITRTIEPSKERLPLNVSSEGVTMQDKGWREWIPDEIGFSPTFYGIGEDGEVGFNWESLLAQGQLELGYKHEGIGNAHATIPYEYSRLFNSAKALRPEDYEKVANYIRQQLLHEFADALQGFDFSKRVYAYQHPEASIESIRNAEISGIYARGFASPEGPKEKGPMTLLKKDSENIKLAEMRAEQARGITRQQLGKAGASLEQLHEDTSPAPDYPQVTGEEGELSVDELRELSALAANESGIDDIERIFNLVIHYNDGNIKDEKALEALDRIIGSKRKVEVDIVYQGKQKKTIIIPLSILPLLLLFWPPPPPPDRDKHKPEPGGNEPSPEIPQEPLPEVPPKLVSEIPPAVRQVTLPDEGSKEYEVLEEATFIDDLYKNIDRPDIIKYGLDYGAFADSMVEQYDKFSNDEERELYLTAVILEAWIKKDKQCRREIGVESDDGLDYFNQPQQIKWARMHARALFELVEAKRALPVEERKTVDNVTLLERRTAQLLRRRTLR